MLTNEQIELCNTFGFVVQRQLFNAAEIHTIGAEAAAAIEELYSDRQGGTHGRWTPLQKPTTPLNASLLQDARFYDAARQLFDERIIGLVSDILLWTGDTGWHRDLDVPGNTGLKFIYYLEPLTTASGCLRVAPGSHKKLQPDTVSPHPGDIPEGEPLRLTPESDAAVLQELKALHESGVETLPALAVETNPGDVIAFIMPLLHASFGGAPNRRICSTVYWAESQTSELREARRKEARVIQSNHYKMFNYPEETPYCEPQWIADARDDPVRQRWVECLRDLEWINPQLNPEQAW